MSDKILIIEQLMNKTNNILMAEVWLLHLLKAMGGTIGKSLCEDDKLDLAKRIVGKAKSKRC